MSDQELDTIFLHQIYGRMSLNDERAVNDLVVRIHSRLIRLTDKMLQGFPTIHRWEDREDVLQMALIKLVRALAVVQPTSSRDFIGLAAEQIRRTLIDLARHYQGTHGLAANHATHFDTEAVAGPVVAADGHQASAVLGFEEWCAFHEAVSRLPALEKEVFSLSFYHGWNQSEIADLLQIHERTVRRLKTSATAELKSLLGGHLPDSPAVE